MTTTDEIYVFTPGTSITKYYLDGRHTAWDGSSTTAWTAQATSPYEMGMNDVTGTLWTPQSAVSQLIASGGPPFALGSQPAYKSYGNVTEPFPLQIRVRANHPDDAIALKQKLWRILNTASSGSPCVLAVKPNGTTRIGYTFIYKADIQETADFINDEDQRGLMRCNITWERAPFFGTLTNGQGNLSSSSLTNSGSGSANVVAFDTSKDYGDLANEGQPTQITFTPAQNTSLVYMATIDLMMFSATGAGALSTSSTTGAATALNAIAPTDLDYERTVRARVFMRFSNNTSNVQIRVEARGNTSGTLLYAGQWITPTASIASIVDMGRIPLSIWRDSVGSQSIQLYIGYRSTNGSSATTTLTSNEFILYYDLCRVDTTITPASNPRNLAISSFRGGTNIPVLPRLMPTAVTTTNTNTIFDNAVLRGSPPRYRSGKSLYVTWMRPTGHTTTDTATVSVDYAPLWVTLRGSDGT